MTELVAYNKTYLLYNRKLDKFPTEGPSQEDTFLLSETLTSSVRNF